MTCQVPYLSIYLSTHIYSAIKVFQFLMNVTKKEEKKKLVQCYIDFENVFYMLPIKFFIITPICMYIFVTCHHVSI